MTLTELGWQSFFSAQLIDVPDDAWPARVAQIHRTHCVIWSEQGESELEIGVLPDPKDIAVGDWLLMPADGKRPLRRLERRSRIARKAWGNTTDEQLMAANIDSLFIVSACDNEFNESRIERYLSLAAEAGINPVVVLTKADLADTTEQYAAAAADLLMKVPVVAVNALDPATLGELELWCGEGQTIALLGSSGVGKSTLTNSLAGAEQKTGAVREEDSKGRHTTTTRSLHRLHTGGLVIDTPGMRELQLPTLEDGIEETFEDIQALISRCRFRNCGHQAEPGCAVNAALESEELSQRRWESYNKLTEEQATLSETIARRKEKGRKLALEVSSAKANKQARKNH